MAINGVALGALGIGGIFFYSAIKGKSVLATTQSVITGKSPATVKQAYPITDNSPTSTDQQSSSVNGGVVANTGTNKSILQKTAAGFGWTGAQWTALDRIELQEAGYSSTIKNGSSGALGMAQALGHGNANTAGILGNEYGGYGLTDGEARKANDGDAAYQSLWMCRYIKAVYNNPVNAEQFHLANNWY
jgi:hypothetical protein